VAVGELGRAHRQIQIAFEAGTVTGLTDRELVEQFAASRDPAGELAFAALVQRHGPMVLRVCRSILRNPQDSEDAFQATFLILARKAGSLWVRDSVGPWLHEVACRVAACSKAATARRRRHERRSADLNSPQSNVHDDHEDLTALVHTELGHLPDKYRAPIVLCDLEGQSYEAAARQLGCPIGTVKSRLARGRIRLRDRIERRGAGPSLGVIAGALSEATHYQPVSRALIDATAQLADRLNSGYSATGVAPATILDLMHGALKMMLLSKLKLAAACVAIGSCLFSLSVFTFGPVLSAGDPIASDVEFAANRVELSSSSTLDEPGKLPRQPKPWESVVRVKGQGKDLFRSGTIIHSTQEESIVLTSAHRFMRDPEEMRQGIAHPDGSLDKPARSKFPVRIKVDLFDGKMTGDRPAQVHFLESVDGEAIDFDFERDVALIRIRPGRRLPASRVVPPQWKPKARMHVLTVGCSGGNDATAWHTTITKRNVIAFAGKPRYDGIECEIAPKQGRSGGGLFTDDGYVAGVCNFADQKSNCGIYAAPSSIYHILDVNGLASVYERTGVGEGNPGGLIRAAPEEMAPARPPDSPDHERRLRAVEQKLDRVLELLERAERDRKPSR
jgi:RNA polymerase sigma factor (sigma-70 family)